MVFCLERGAVVAQLMPLPLDLASVKSRLVLSFWYRPTRVVPEKGPLNVRVCTHIGARNHAVDAVEIRHRTGSLGHRVNG